MKIRLLSLAVVALALCLGLGYVAPLTPRTNAFSSKTARTATEIAITTPSGMYTADFNNDTYPDLVVQQAIGNNRYATVLISNGAGGYLAPNQISIPPLNGSPAKFRIVAKDFTNDGKVDMAVFIEGVNGVPAAARPGALKFLQGDGLGGFAPLTDVSGS
jgi:hypothetical protein